MDQNTTLLFICLISSRALSDLPGFLNLAFDECLISMKNLGQNSCMSKVYSSVFSALACRCHLAVIFNIQCDLVTVRWISLLVVEECYFSVLKNLLLLLLIMILIVGLHLVADGIVVVDSLVHFLVYPICNMCLVTSLRICLDQFLPCLLHDCHDCHDCLWNFLLSLHIHNCHQNHQSYDFLILHF